MADSTRGDTWRSNARFPAGLNPDDYWQLLDEFDLTDEQKNELLIYLWNEMSSFAAENFGPDSNR